MYDVDYSNIFSPVTKFTSVCLFIFVVVSRNWSLQLDIVNVFIHGDLNEEVYMEQPPEFVAQVEYDKVCHLRRSLFGMKQSGHDLFDKFSEVAHEFWLNKSVTFFLSSTWSQQLKLCFLSAMLMIHYMWWLCKISCLTSFFHTKLNTKDLG